MEQFIYGNFLDNAVRDAYTIKKGIVTLATVTTNFSGNISSSSVSLSGNVIDDGGGVVTTRGIAWGTVYNPDTNNNTKPAGEGAGSFETVIDGLAEGETYYARTYATNSFGTAYGNCISFIAGNTVGLIGIETNDRDFNIYPNPASAETTLSFTVESSENVVVTIVNMNGQIMLKKDLGSLSLGENRVKLNISNLENGLYHCQLSNIVNVKASEKLLIAR